MPSPRALATTLAVLLVVGAGALVVRTGAPGPPSPAPSQTSTPASSPVAPTPSPTATSSPVPLPTATPSPRDTSPGQAVPGLDALTAQIHQVRGLPVLRPLDARLVDPPSLADIIGELVAEELQPERIEQERRVLVALGLLGEDVDLRAAIEALYREQVIGLYVPEQQRLYVAADRAVLSPYERFTAAHEVTHALQDQAFGLEMLTDLPDMEADASLALHALVEGDAVLTQQLWAARFQTDEERAAARAAAGRRGGAAFAQSPRYLREVLAFPYREGAAFVARLHDRDGYRAVDEAFRRPPRSTAEILHPERYLAGIVVEQITVDGEPGAGWQPALTATFGEFDLRELLHPLGHGAAAQAAAGWAGGQIRSWQRGDATSVGVALVFDDVPEALEACRALQEWAAKAAARTAVECDGARVDVGVGPDDATASAAA